MIRHLRTLNSQWLFLRILVFAAAVPVLMRLRLPRLNNLLERRIASAVASGGDQNRPEEILDCVESAIAIGSPILRKGCLTRGLTLYYFLRRAGLSVALCFGARSKQGELVEGPGHCWLEKDGQPLFERGNPYAYSVPIYRLPDKDETNA